MVIKSRRGCINLFWEFFLARDRAFHAFFWVKPKIIAPADRGENNIAELFLQLIVCVRCSILTRVAFIPAQVAEPFAKTYDDLRKCETFSAPNGAAEMKEIFDFHILGIHHYCIAELPY